MAESPLRLGHIVAGFWDAAARTYRIVRKESVHHARKMNGYGIQASIIAELDRLGCRAIILDEVRDRGSGSTWRMEIPFAEWASGERATLRTSDGEQVFLRIGRLPKGVRIKEAR